MNKDILLGFAGGTALWFVIMFVVTACLAFRKGRK